MCWWRGNRRSKPVPASRSLEYCPALGSSVPPQTQSSEEFLISSLRNNSTVTMCTYRYIYLNMCAVNCGNWKSGERWSVVNWGCWSEILKQFVCRCIFFLAWEFLEYLLIQQYINTERTLFILLTCYWHMQHNTVALTCLLWRCFSTGICVSSSSYNTRVHNIDHSFIGQHKP